MSSPSPTLRAERALLRSAATRLAGVDEVGRGAPAGPASCGVVVIDAGVGRAPLGLKDSKLLSAQTREGLVASIERWALDSAVGHASAEEVDALGLTAALRLAGHRALSALSVPVDLVLLDGSFDWLSRPEQPSLLGGGEHDELELPPVVTRVKADLGCASVAAASVLAKVARDAIMAELSEQYPGYGWESNKGYGSAGHIEAIRRMGLTPEHRKSWKLQSSAP